MSKALEVLTYLQERTLHGYTDDPEKTARKYSQPMREEALQALHDGVIAGLPEKVHEAQDPEYAAKVTNYWNKGYNRAIDDITKFLNEYFGMEE